MGGKSSKEKGKTKDDPKKGGGKNGANTKPATTKPVKDTDANGTTTKKPKNPAKESGDTGNGTDTAPTPKKPKKPKEPKVDQVADADPPADLKVKKPKKPSTPPADEASEDSATPEVKPKKTKGGEDKATPSPSSPEKGAGDLADDLVGTQKKKVGKEDFDLLMMIGRGSFGKVMQVRYKKTGQIYAMKVMRKEAIIAKNQVAHTRDEKNILQKIQHPFIVKLNFAFQTKDKLYMILDYVNGGELFYHLKKEGKFSEERVRFYAAEISSALIHLHANGIIYRDLKPENILLDKMGHIVITDFGLSKDVPMDDVTHTFCGTPEYLAPEVLRGQGHTYPVDWWSLGTLIYEMLTGLPPFYSKHVNVMYQKILGAPLTFPSTVGEDAKDLLEGLLTRDAEARLGGEDVRKHPFFASIDWKKLEARELDAPWKPPVKDMLDTTQIDDYFKQEKPGDSVVENSFLDDMSDDDKDIFKGFTFGGTQVLGDENDESSSSD